MSNRIAILSRIDFNLDVKYWQVLRKIGIPLFILTVIGTMLDQLITVKMEGLLMDPQGTSPLVWVFGALSLVLGLTYPLATLFLILSSQQEKPVPAFFAHFFEQGVIEQMRSWGKAMLWSFLLIIPGLIKFVQYIFVPFIVCFDPAYQRGEKDALKQSQALAHGKMIQLFLLFFTFTLLIPGTLTAFDEWKLIWQTPLSALFICLIEMLLNLCFIQILWKMYQRSAQA